MGCGSRSSIFMVSQETTNQNTIAKETIVALNMKLYYHVTLKITTCILKSIFIYHVNILTFSLCSR